MHTIETVELCHCLLESQVYVRPYQCQLESQVDVLAALLFLYPKCEPAPALPICLLGHIYIQW